MKNIYLLILVFTLSSCNAVRHLTGLDRHDAKEVDVPVAVTLIRQLPTDGNIIFTPSDIGGSPNNVRSFIKNFDWNTPAPGSYFEIQVLPAFDVAISSEYLVIDYIAQVGHVYNQSASGSRTIFVESVPPHAFDPGRPGA